MTGPIGPGTVFAGRYRLDDLLTESDGARFWRATDTILARSVAIHAVSSSDERAPHLLEAARVSATVTDPHLLRVLDCSDDNGVTWVVHEWGDGISLDLMLQQGTLPPSRAAWLAREVAEAIAAGHAQGVAHGRLNPEAVLVTHAGAVKLIGYVVDATLERPRPPDPLYGELDEREADVINLAGILYAALTGRWPGVARSAVPTVSRSWAATTGQPASLSLRCRSAHLRQLVTDGTTSGPTKPAPSRTRTARCGIRAACRSRSIRGSATSESESTTRSVVSAVTAACGWLVFLIRAPEQRSALVSKSESGPRPWMRMEAERVRGRGIAFTPPASTSPATRSAIAVASTPSLPLWTSSRVAPDCRARSRWPSAAVVIPAGGRISSARRGSQPTCTMPSGRDNTGVAGLSA